MSVLLPAAQLQAHFGDRLQCNVAMDRFTAARLGGSADWLLTVETLAELRAAVSYLRAQATPFILLGGGSNVLVSDAGIRELVILNRARAVRFFEDQDPPTVWAASGANFGLVARQAASRGLAGLEWAAGIPGTVGGAVFGNAGAHGSDLAANLLVAEILHPDGKSIEMGVADFEYAYRSSVLKRNPTGAIILSATLQLARSLPQVVKEKMEALTAYRRRTQPPGASMGSMFKNPAGDYAGRLIEAAGLKGVRSAGAQISELHANFFINTGQATATDVHNLINLACATVFDKFGVALELEIELLGEW